MREGLRALRDAGDTTSFEGMDPDGPLPPFVTADENIAAEVDATEYVDRKMAAMRAYPTQITLDGPFFALSNNVGSRPGDTRASASRRADGARWTRPGSRPTCSPASRHAGVDGARLAPLMLMAGLATGVLTVAVHQRWWSLALGVGVALLLLVAAPRGWWTRLPLRPRLRSRCGSARGAAARGGLPSSRPISRASSCSGPPWWCWSARSPRCPDLAKVPRRSEVGSYHRAGEARTGRA